MRRREFVGLVGGAAAWPLGAGAQQQQPPLPVIGLFSADTPEVLKNLLPAFHRGLAEGGYSEGRNVTIEYRYAQRQPGQLKAIVDELVRRRVSVIVAPSNANGVMTAKAATAAIPIVFETTLDPVARGMVASLSRPGGNVTGVTSLNTELGPKRLEVLHELLPAARTLALLVNPEASVGSDALVAGLEATARTLGLPQVHVLTAGNDREIEIVFETLAELRVEGLTIGTSPFFNSRSEQLAALALRHKVPAISPYREFARAGGLMSYGGDVADLYRLLGNYTSRVLKGDRPADLPVQQITRVELVINMKTAKALGLTFPLALLGRADEAIE
jgi:putative ABC transport system substrate-binding protein